MSDVSPAPKSPNSPLLRAIVWAGLIAGLLDLAYVVALTLSRNGDPMRTLQGMAAAVVGPAARNPHDWGYAIVGLALHFVIAYVWAALFCVAASFRPYLVRQPGIVGPLFGAFVWLMMQLVVLPYTKTPPKAFPPPNWEPIFLAHLLCVGLPIALVAARFFAPAKSTPAPTEEKSA